MNPPKTIAGMDEAGRGPWAGPVVAAAVILPPRIRLPGLNDSKLLKEARRELLHESITKLAKWGVGMASSQEVDHYGLTVATQKAYRRALKALQVKPHHLMVDGRDDLKLPYPATYIIKGDQKVRAISAASVVAKVTRDRLMRDQATNYPQYGFEHHKGYGTRIHQAALNKHGITPLHRQSYKPIQTLKYAHET